MVTRIRTKIEAFALAMVLMCLGGLVGLVSSDIYLSDARNDYYTMITTSQGGVYAPEVANIQTAINSLGGSGGTVWIPESVTSWGTPTVPANVRLVGYGNQTLNSGTCSIVSGS